MDKPTYIVVKATDPDNLAAQVNAACAQGYDPIGGITSSGCALRGTLRLLQPMQRWRITVAGKIDEPKKGGKHRPKPQDKTR
jgi:hypothetical protein